MDDQHDTAQPTTEEILAEVERRRAEARRLKSEERHQIFIVLDRIVFWLSRHWLALLNVLALLYTGLPFLSPVLTYLGATEAGAVIRTVYRPLCHQMPQRSWFLFGPQVTYTLEELTSLTGLEKMVPDDWQVELTEHPGKEQPILPVYVALAVDVAVGPGSEDLGYKVVLCQRDTAIYGTIFLAGLVFALLRRRWKVRPLPWWAYAGLGVLPMLLDGGIQWLAFNLLPILYWRIPPLATDLVFIGPYETTPLLRAVTGMLFGLMTVWLAYPHVQGAMDEFHETLEKRLG